ncbi:ATP-binding protein [Sunxiuqinia sp. A32]|uniref:ATP-binding protein n=1 Tax=Sunxiuqinia sp. A32 TaxID=3461496 RepID=UPI00404591F1
MNKRNYILFRESVRKHLFVILSGLFFIVAFSLEHQLVDHMPEKKLGVRFQKKLHEQQRILDEKLDEIQEYINDDDFDGNFQAKFQGLSQLYEKNRLGFMVMEGRDLYYWSNNHFSFEEHFLDVLRTKRLVNLPNGVFLTQHRKVDNLDLVGLILLKNNYSIQNQYIQNDFVKPFNLPESFIIQEGRSSMAIPIKGVNGEYLFSLKPNGKIHCNYSQLYFPVFLFGVALFFLILYARQLTKQFRHENFVVRMTILGLSLFGFYWFHILFEIPRSLYYFDLFGPGIYAFSFWLPSLGDLFILAFLIFFWSINFIKELDYAFIKKRSEIIIAFIFSALFYLSVNCMIQNLIRNSSISFQLNQIDDITQYSVVGFFIVAILFFSSFLINLKVIDSAEKYFERKRFLWVHAQVIVVFVILAFLFKDSYIYMICLFLITNFSIVALRNTQLKRHSLSYLIFFVSLFAFFTLIIIQHHNNIRKVEIQKLMAVNLNSEHDPAAEVFLTEMQVEMSTDSIIPNLLTPPYQNLEYYLNRKYFSGYFQKYDIQVTACSGSDSLLIEPDNQMEPCFPFFDEMINDYGTRIPGTRFYYLDNMNGRISYFGKLFYPLTSDSVGISIFLEFNSKLLPEGAGFPELLLDESMIKPDRYRHFSYAKYFDRSLVHLSGDYQYNYYIDSYEIDKDSAEFNLEHWDGYDHLIYSLGHNNYIIVTNKSFDGLDYLISFPYLFVFYFLFILVFVILGNPAYRKQAMVYDLKFKIQAAIISVVLCTLFFVAGGTIYYNIQEYENKHQYDLNEKMKSIAEEIDNRLNDVSTITPEWRDWLWRELNKLSNIFRTDINIYGVDGKLIASSRPEIYIRGILSQRMNADAYYELIENYQVNYFQPEKIGNLSFLSIYEPIINNNGDYLGFLNLPYFTRGDKLKQEISTFIVAFINLYVLLFLASVIVAVLLANQITKPLSLVREKLRGIQLDKKNEQISYQRDDEIGSLVKEYNRKVEELAESAEILARTEREVAWREMAKQVAHEIKNPLTPMKLNIQYLQRAKAEKSEHYDDYFDRVTRTLIEQIDTLSDIATEFSNFAKIPKANNDVFNLCDKLQKVTGLFESSMHVDFTLDLNGYKEILIFADREQISRAVMNLVKNAIQSIPSNRKGKICVSLSKEENQAVIAVSDNGSGIPENIRQQMFQPNFTTKTSGMGLGLAIVKKIIENSGGTIWFETVINKGTTFYINIPLYRSAE